MAKRNKKQEEPEDPVTKWYGVEPEKPKVRKATFHEEVSKDLTMAGNWVGTFADATPSTYGIKLDENKTYTFGTLNGIYYSQPTNKVEVQANYDLMKDQWEYLSKTTKWEKDEYSDGVTDASGYIKGVITSNETPSAEEVEKMYETYHKQKYYSTSIAPTVVSSDQTITWTTGTYTTTMPIVSYSGGWKNTYSFPLDDDGVWFTSWPTLPDDQLDFGFEG